MKWIADLEVTRRCDLRCEACFVRAQPAPEAELPLDVLLGVLDQLDRRDCLVHLTGGEPFLHPGIDRILDRVATSRISGLVVNTNATSVGPERLERLAALPMPALLLVSLDGPPGAHDRSRGEGVTLGALRVLREARCGNLRAEPASILTRELLDHGLEAWWNWLADRLGRPVDLAAFPLFLAPGRRPNARDVGTPLAPADLHRAADQVAALQARGCAVGVVDFPLINPLLRARGVPVSALHTCQAGRGRFCVQADGWISPCHPLQHRLFPLGSDLLFRLARHPTYRALGRRTFDECASCGHLDICGHCRAVVAGRGAMLLGQDDACASAGVRQTPSHRSPGPWA